MAAAGMKDDEQEEHHRLHPPLPGNVPHRCSDPIFILLLAAALGGLYYIGMYAYDKGDLGKFSMRRYELSCNSSDLSPTVGGNGSLAGTGQLYHFWCVNEQSSADRHILLNHTLCVDACPKDDSTEHNCMDPGLGIAYPIKDYSTHVMYGKYCMPTDKALAKQVAGAIDTSDTLATNAVWVVMQLYSGFVPVLVAVLISIVVGYLYIFLLQNHADCIVRVCAIVMVLVPGLLGGQLVREAATMSPEELMIGTPAQQVIGGSALMFLAFCVILLFCCVCQQLEVAVGCVEAAAACMFEEPTLLLEPFISLVLKVGMLVGMIYGFLLLASTGVKMKDEGTLYVTFNLEYSSEQGAYIAFWLFMFVWLQEFCHCTSQYVLAWVAQMWYFTPYNEDEIKEDLLGCGICHAYFNALVYHVGTLALGSLLISVTRPIRAIVGAFASVAKSEQNPLSGCVQGSCSICVSCFDRGLGWMSKHAFMDVARTSSNFCTAAERAYEVITTEHKAVQSLNGAMFVFQLAGWGLITSLATAATAFIVKNLNPFKDDTSSMYIMDWRPVTAAAFAASSAVAWNFLVVFDTVGDTILYCYATEQRRHAYVANSLRPGEQEDQGYFAWLWGGADPESQTEIEQTKYAPPRLRQLIDEFNDEEATER